MVERSCLRVVEFSLVSGLVADSEVCTVKVVDHKGGSQSLPSVLSTEPDLSAGWWHTWHLMTKFLLTSSTSLYPASCPLLWPGLTPCCLQIVLEVLLCNFGLTTAGPWLLLSPSCPYDQHQLLSFKDHLLLLPPENSREDGTGSIFWESSDSIVMCRMVHPEKIMSGTCK